MGWLAAACRRSLESPRQDRTAWRIRSGVRCVHGHFPVFAAVDRDVAGQAVQSTDLQLRRTAADHGPSGPRGDQYAYSWTDAIRQRRVVYGPAFQERLLAS